ncbi:MAG: PHP domain-containing protein, partial [Burkholderiaceae bacterium]|nr:PHP domain-containing protein [Burkholderiaceae bacterium]
MLPAYAELHCVSNFSFLRGASHPEEMVERALVLDYAGLALTDECSFAGSVRAHLALEALREDDAAARDFRLIHGTEIALADGPKLVLLAASRAGYGNLSQLVTLARRQAPKGSYRLTRADIESHAPLLADCLALLVPAPDAALARAEARWLADLLPRRAWIACELLRGPDDAAWLSALQAISRDSGLPLVAAGDVHMHVRRRKRLQDVLTAIRHRLPLDRC